MDTIVNILFISLLPKQAENMQRVVDILERQRMRTVRCITHPTADIYLDDPHSAGHALSEIILTPREHEYAGCIISEERSRLLSTARALERSFMHTGVTARKPVIFTDTSTNADRIDFQLGMAAALCITGLPPEVCIAANGLHPIARCQWDADEDVFVSV